LVSLCKYTLTDPNDTQALAGLIDHFAIEPPSRARETTKSLCSRLGDCGADIEVKGREILIHKAGSGKVPGELVDEIRLHDDDMVAQVAGEAKALSPHVAELLERCAADTRRIDFDDMIWLPVHLNLPVRRKSLLLVDEAQDLNRCQQALVKRIGEEGRIVPIGDRWQSLYAFTGADPEALPRLSGELETSSKGSKSYPLTVTWRCPVSHVRLARRIVPDLQAAPNAGEGTVGSIGDDDLIGQIEAGDMVISRRNAPLVSLAMKLAAFSGVGIVLRGRDIGKSLQVLIDDLATGTPKELIKALKKYQEKELDRLDAVEASEDAIESLMDRVACLVEIASRCDSIGDIARRISDVFGDDDQNTEGKVVLSSVHRAKGLEANRVFIIDTGCLPMIRSCRRCGGKGCPSCDQRGTRARPWQVQTELNLAYVAVTRAKRELYFVGDTPALFGGSF
jgi:superfamily I DNA/RNA helicase